MIALYRLNKLILFILALGLGALGACFVLSRYRALSIGPIYATRVSAHDGRAADEASRRRAASQPTKIDFSGYNWIIKDSTGSYAGPGPNVFAAENVRVDKSGRLHLRISRKNGNWSCAEVVSARTFGYGVYSWTVTTDPADLDSAAVLGLFTWDAKARERFHSEVDIEAARWRTDDGANCQFAVQPWDRFGHRLRFKVPRNSSPATYTFEWMPDRIIFRATDRRGSIIKQWSFNGTVPKPLGQARMNLWIYHGGSTTNGKEADVVINSFAFTPAKRPAS